MIKYALNPKPEKSVKVYGRAIRISRKSSVTVCRYITGKSLKSGKSFLEGMISKTSDLNGKYYTNVAAEILGLKEYNDPAIVAGFAGGVGLSGNVCGALAATLYALAVKYFVDRNKPKHGMLRSNMQGIKIEQGSSSDFWTTTIVGRPACGRGWAQVYTVRKPVGIGIIVRHPTSTDTRFALVRVRRAAVLATGHAVTVTVTVTR